VDSVNNLLTTLSLFFKTYSEPKNLLEKPLILENRPSILEEADDLKKTFIRQS